MSEQLKPELRFPEFDECWKLLKLGNITSKIGSGKTPRGGESNYQLYGVPFIRSQNVQNGSLELDDTHIPLEIHEEMSNSKTKPFDILLNITGASIGRCCIVPEDLKEANVNQHVSIIRIESGEPLFYQNFIISHSGQKLIYQQQTTGGKEGLNFKSIRNFKVPSPSVEEQQKIANFLKAIEKRIKLLKAKEDALEEYKTSIMQKLFSQEIRFKQDDGSDFPDWEQYKLGDIGSTLNGLTGKTKDDFGEGYPYVQYMQIFKNSKIDTSDFGYVNITPDDNQTKIQYGDILFTTSSETRKEVGTSSVMLEQVENLYLNSFSFGFRLDSFEILIPEFARYLFRSYDIRKMVVRLGQGSTRYNMSKVAFMKDSVTLPVKEEQIKIAKILSNADEKIERISEKIDVLTDFKQSLLQKMFV